jgi:hypothetical protein
MVKDEKTKKTAEVKTKLKASEPLPTIISAMKENLTAKERKVKGKTYADSLTGQRFSLSPLSPLLSLLSLLSSLFSLLSSLSLSFSLSKLVSLSFYLLG